MITLADIVAARDRIAGGIYESPCVESIPLSQLTGARIHCKLDYLQRTGSFKERGARNALLQLSSEQRKRGVIAASVVSFYAVERPWLALRRRLERRWFPPIVASAGRTGHARPRLHVQQRSHFPLLRRPGPRPDPAAASVGAASADPARPARSRLPRRHQARRRVGEGARRGDHSRHTQLRPLSRRGHCRRRSRRPSRTTSWWWPRS